MLTPELERTFDGARCQYGISEWDYTGSRAICPEAAKDDADYDVICLVADMPEESVPYQDRAAFWSIRIGKLNLLLTDSEDFFDKFVYATKVAKALKLAKREDRVTLFQVILYDRFPVEEVKLSTA